MELELLITQPAEHFPMLQPKPPWSPLFPPKIPTEFRSYMRTNSEFLRLTGVLWELTQSWPFTHHVSTLSSYWRCFSWGPGPMTTLFWLAHIIAEKLQEGLPCISESSTICGGLRAMRPITEDYIATFILRWQFIQSVQSATSCVQWDPGGFDFVELAANRHRLGRYTELQDSCSPSWLADGTSHMLKLHLQDTNFEELAANWHRLEGKPVVKEEGMSATQSTAAATSTEGATMVAQTAAMAAKPTATQTGEPRQRAHQHMGRAGQVVTPRAGRLQVPSQDAANGHPGLDHERQRRLPLFPVISYLLYSPSSSTSCSSA